MMDAHWRALTVRLMPTLFVAVRSNECVARKDPALGRERSGTGRWNCVHLDIYGRHVAGSLIAAIMKFADKLSLKAVRSILSGSLSQ
jgi:hypothetical protein